MLVLIQSISMRLSLVKSSHRIRLRCSITKIQYSPTQTLRSRQLTFNLSSCFLLISKVMTYPDYTDLPHQDAVGLLEVKSPRRKVNQLCIRSATTEIQTKLTASIVRRQSGNLMANHLNKQPLMFLSMVKIISEEHLSLSLASSNFIEMSQCLVRIVNSHQFISQVRVTNYMHAFLRSNGDCSPLKLLTPRLSKTTLTTERLSLKHSLAIRHFVPMRQRQQIGQESTQL